jgi:lipoprotein-anchoring transpeptidase ErfK/SrfK
LESGVIMRSIFKLLIAALALLTLAGTPASAMMGSTQVPLFWPHVKVTVSLSRQQMSFAAVTPDARRLNYTWSVSTGRKGYETPVGKYQPVWADAEHKSSIYEDAPMPFAVFFVGGYAIHGTTEVKHLGKPASHGCVRLDPANAEIFYNAVNAVGLFNTTIQIVD